MSEKHREGPLRFVHLEDDPNDVVLVRSALDEVGLPLDVAVVSTRDAFAEALTSREIDVVLSDYALPNYDGLSALALTRQLVPGVPFILISGTLGEEAAIESLRGGATDYVLKHRLSRLVPAVRRALQESSDRATRRSAEAALERERQFLRAVLDSLATGVVACDGTGVPTVCNPPIRTLYGLPDEPVAPEQWGSYYRLCYADRKTAVGAAEMPLVRALAGERLRNQELTIQRRNGTERAVLVNGQPILDARGYEIGAVVAMQDITERKQLEEQFRQAQKMEGMGQLAAGVAHDFNNLLTVITGHCELLRRRTPAGSAHLRDLEAVEKASQRAVRLTRQLLAFSRQQILEPRVLDLNGVIAEMQKLLARVIGANVELLFKPAPDLEHVHADAGQMEQILMNLIVNARDAMPSGGSITIETGNVSMTKPDSSGPARRASADATTIEGGTPTAAIPPGRYVLLTVTDMGCGMDPDVLAHIFEPFFTTKGAGKGTGLGLSTVHGIVTQSGGHITVQSELGAGTTFNVYLPTTAQPEAPSKHASTETKPAVGAETILVVDDDESLRELVTEILQLAGHAVVEAADGESALALMERGGAHVDAMITDVIMPKLSGRELVDRLGTVRPNLPTLYMSGYMGQSVEAITGDPRKGIGFIQKPFTPEALVRKLREVLDTPRGAAQGLDP